MKNTYRTEKQKKLYKTQNVLNIIVLLFLMILTISCGGGGSSSGTPASNNPDTIITGVVSKGLVKNGTVKIYSIKNGVRDILLKQVTTDDRGEYTANIANYKGPVLLEAYGSYIDEATLTQKTIPSSAPLRAFHHYVKGNMVINITPLTEIAVANSGLTFTNISSLNQKVKDAFKIDIIKTKPLDPSVDISMASQNQKDYTLILAAISQMMKDNNTDIAQLINTIKTDVLDGQINDNSIKNMFITAMQNFIASSENKTNITQIPDTIVAIGGKKNIFTRLNATGTGTIYGIKFTIELPSGVEIIANGSGEVEKGVITPKISGANIVAKYTKGNPSTIDITIASTDGFSAGDLAVVNLLMDSSMSTPNSNQFQIKNIEAYDENGNSKTGFGIILNMQ